MEELLQKINFLEEENKKLKCELNETKEHLKKYTAPSRHKTYYENHKEEILNKQKSYVVSSEKKKEYARQAYLNKKEKQKVNLGNI
jgi:hypothetical protein